MKLVLGVVVVLSLLSAGCGGGNRWGYGREYVPLDDHEEAMMDRALDVPLEDVRRDPASYRASMVSWFGVVSGLESSGGGRTLLRLSFRTHVDRHLCEDASEDTCRVTVTERSTGGFSAVVTLRDEDTTGIQRVWTGTLVRIYGNPTGDYDEQGDPVILARWYRHWPRGQYVTTAARATMRR